ncbi:NHL repeat protein [Cooperia oncophora]
MRTENSFDEKEVFNKKLGPIKNATIAVIRSKQWKDAESFEKQFCQKTDEKVISMLQILEEHGQNLFYMPHGITIDEKGNYWVTDVGSHQVHKLDTSFRPILSLGEKLVPGNDGSHFCKPTDIAVAKNGYFFVADGYCNSRVLKFDPSGKLVDSFGAAGGAYLMYLLNSHNIGSFERAFKRNSLAQNKYA